MTMISDNLQQVRARIATACAKAMRSENSVQLLAVSKTFGPEAVEAAFAAGQTAFGENYIQEGVEKIAVLRHLPLQWHMIGPVQSNKTRLVAENFDWVQSLDRLKIAERLNQQRPSHLPALQICIQVNIDDGPNKSGLMPSEVLALARQLAALPRLNLRGLMFIPEVAPDLEAIQVVLTRAKTLFDQLKIAVGLFQDPAQAARFDTLSMGMSADMDTAILCGSTMVRVGTAIFGGRSANA